MTVNVRVFTSNARGMGDICAEAADFASTVGKDRLISISQTKEDAGIWVCVWYWED